MLENLQSFEVISHAREDTLLHLSAEDSELSAFDLAGWKFHLNRIVETSAELFIKLTVSQCSVIEPFPFEEQSFEGFQLSAREFIALNLHCANENVFIFPSLTSLFLRLSDTSILFQTCDSSIDFVCAALTTTGVPPFVFF